jgi:CRISPR/Cas system-associated protein Cas10 (large subunit of type III CRISPR-Cas system)
LGTYHSVWYDISYFMRKNMEAAQNCSLYERKQLKNEYQKDERNDRFENFSRCVFVGTFHSAFNMEVPLSHNLRSQVIH